MSNNDKASERIVPEWSKTAIEKIVDYLTNFISDTVARRIIVLILLCAGVPIWTIAELSTFCTKTVYKIQKAAREGRFSDIFTINGGGRPSKLGDIADKVLDVLEKENFHTYQEVTDMIHDRFGVSVSVSAVHRFLKKNGYKHYRSGSLPAKADAKVQREFYETVLLPLMEKAEKARDDVALLFMDAAHFVIGCDFLGSVISKSRRFLQTFSGRQRHNVLGAIDFVTKKVITEVNDTYINAESVCNILRKIATKYQGKQIYIVLDNARYQKCKIVTELAKELNINLIYLPSYSPNLNLIERLWRFVKTELRKKYYSNFSDFKDRITEIINSVEGKNKGRICSLIGKKVQLYDGLKQIDCHTLVIPKEAA